MSFTRTWTWKSQKNGQEVVKPDLGARIYWQDPEWWQWQQQHWFYTDAVIACSHHSTVQEWDDKCIFHWIKTGWSKIQWFKVIVIPWYWISSMFDYSDVCVCLNGVGYGCHYKGFVAGWRDTLDQTYAMLNRLKIHWHIFRSWAFQL